MNTRIKKRLAVLLSVVMIVSGTFASMAAKAPIQNGWYQVIDKSSGQDTWYYYENGNKKTGWLTDPQDGNKYYLDPETGAMCVGWKLIDNNWYYFGERQYADNRWTRDAAGNWKAGIGRHSFGSMYHDEMTPDGYYVGTNGIWRKSSGSSGSSRSSSGGGSSKNIIIATTDTAQYVGKQFNPNGLSLTIFKSGKVYKKVTLPNDSVWIWKTKVNGKRDGLLRTGNNNVEISFVYSDGDVLIGQSTARMIVRTHLDYSLDENWYQTGEQYDENKIDVFYLLWTVIFQAFDEDGNESLVSTLSNKDRATMTQAFYYSQHMYGSDKCMFGSDKFNFIAPYYRQLTMASFSLPQSKLEMLSAMETVKRDICDAFDYYWKNVNKGERPFIVAGFSQGGLTTKLLLKNMTDEQYSHMIAAYSMGFQVTEDELNDPHINAATGPDDLGVIISYNSVATPSAIWSAVSGEAAICINPINWGATPSELTTEYGDKATVHVEEVQYGDHKSKVLIIEGLDNEKYGGQSFDGTKYPMPEGNYHMWEMRFYADKIRENALHRAELFSSPPQ